jgi:ABC-type transporter Mla subunit MlaD
VLAVAVALVVALESTHLAPGMTVHVELARVGALQPGAKVRLASLRLGSVEAIRLTPDAHALLDLWIDRRHAWLLRTTTDFFLLQEGLLGETYVEIAARPGPRGPELEDGATVRGVDPPPIDELLVKSYKNLMATSALFQGGLPELPALRAALAELDRTLASMEAPTGLRPLLRAASGLELGPVAADARALAARADADLPALRARVAALGRALAAAGARLDDPRLARLGAAIDAVGPVLSGLERARAAAEALAAGVAAGRGTLGAFLQDVELADEMKGLLRELRKDPLRVLSRP